MNARKNIMLGTAGHVDHGKTALVKLLTGCETDTLAEEKRRGLTIDLGFAPCRMSDDRIVGVVDVPGHVDFIRNMVAGAHGIDVVILVVAADDGIMPQTREHLSILTLTGLKHGVVALTKIDLVEPARRAEVAESVRRLLQGTFLAGAPICPMSNITGEGYGEFFDALNDTAARCGERPCSGPFRMWVEDVFTIHGQGTVITGIPTRGSVKVGETLHLLPAGLSGKVRRMQVYGEDSIEGRAGECLALNIPEIDHLRVKRGMILEETGSAVPVTMAEAEFHVLDSVVGVIEDYPEVHLHIGTASSLARVAMLETARMGAGQGQMVQLRMEEPLPVAVGERFVLRANLPGQGQNGLVTIGGGRLVGVSNTRLRRQKQWTIDFLRARASALDDPALWCGQMIRESGKKLTPAELEGECPHLKPDELAAVAKALQARGAVFSTASGAWVHREVIDKLSAALLQAMDAFHKANPQRAGADRAELFAGMAVDTELGALVFQQLLAAKAIEPAGTGFARTGWSARLPERDQTLYDQIRVAFQAAGWAGPGVAELSTAFHEAPDRVERMIKLLCERGILIRLDPQLCIHQQALESAKKIALQLFAKKPIFSTMEFRDALGVSRKFAVPLVDYLDKIRFTVRNGNNRLPGVEARKLS